jgi:hypothetical protein
MPKEGEPSRKSKELLKNICKVRIVKPTPKEDHHRPTARLFWGCYNECNKTYTCYRSLQRHWREAHKPPTHKCGCGNEFKRLEYLLYHQQKCIKRNICMQTVNDIEHNNVCVNCKQSLFFKQSSPPKKNRHDLHVTEPMHQQEKGTHANRLRRRGGTANAKHLFENTDETRPARY